MNAGLLFAVQNGFLALTDRVANCELDDFGINKGAELGTVCVWVLGVVALALVQAGLPCGSGTAVTLCVLRALPPAHSACLCCRCVPPSYQDTVEGRVSRAKALTLGNALVALMDGVVRLQGFAAGGLPAPARRRIVALFNALEALRGVAKALFTTHATASSSGTSVAAN